MKRLRSGAYRPDIDGMRAIAVLSVVLFHIEKTLVPGGFAGVDIFFVISGYLITLHIYGQMQTGTFAFADFYKRRINRIAPALFTLIGSVCVAALVILSPGDLIRLFKSAVYACLGLSNIFFWREYGNYFSSGIDEAPLLHTWSLAVEEQFYILWPLMLLVIVRLKPLYRFALIGLGVVATIAVSELGTRNAASASYYLLPTRFFELLIGGALAIYATHQRSPINTRVANLLAVLGLSLMLGSLYLLNETVTFPGIHAMFPCMGTALLIAAGMGDGSAINRVLSVKPLVFVGLISYSLYLWHWPVIAFAHYRGISIDVVTGCGIFVLSAVLGWASWKFVETPSRRSGSALAFRTVLTRRFVVPAAAIVLGFAGVAGTNGLANRFDARVLKYEKIIATASNELRPECHSPTLLYARQPSPACVLGVPGKAPEVFMVGDSFANHFTGMIDILAKNDHVTVTDYTMDGCLPVKGMGFGAQESYARKCKARNEFVYKYISSHRFKYVILAGAWPVDSSPADFAALQTGLSNSVATVIASGAKPIIIINNESTTNANCLVRRAMTGSGQTCDKKQEPHAQRDAVFAKLKETYSGLTMINPNQVICSNGSCHAMMGDIPLYRDTSHLNDVGSRAIGQALVAKRIHLIPVESEAQGHASSTAHSAPGM